MKLWKRASQVLRDQTGIWLATFSKRTALRNPDIEAAVIKSTSHDKSRLDYRNAQRVFALVRVSPAYLKPLVWSITVRMEKTRMENTYGESWGHNEFIRAYYSFLDQKSLFMLLHAEEQHRRQLRKIGENQDDEKSSMMHDLVWLQRMQDLLDMLLLIKPKTGSMVGTLILEAMDCVVVEIFDVYSRICSGIAKVLNMIYSAGKVEASMALKILQKATKQGDELSLYFVFCREIFVINSSGCPQMQQIPEEDIKELEHILINGVSEKSNCKKATAEDRELTLVRLKTRTTAHEQQNSTSSNLETIITNQWQEFDEDHSKIAVVGGKVEAKEHLLPLIPLSDIHVHAYGSDRVLPDLISL